MTAFGVLLVLLALAIGIFSKGRKTGLALVISTLAVGMFWHDNFSTPDWVIFWIIIVIGLIYTAAGRFHVGARVVAGFTVLVVGSVLATTWDIRPDFDTVAAEAVSTTIPVTVTVLPSTTDADGNTEDVPIVQETATDDTVTDESSTEDLAIPPTVTCDQGGTIAEMVACIEKAPNKAEIVKYLDANEIGILGNDEAGTTWERLAAYPADLDSRVILVLNAPDVTDAEVRAVAAKTMGELAERAKIVRREGVVLVNSYIDPATGEVKSYADARKQIRTITTFADTGKEALVLAYNGQGILGGCLNGSKGVIIKEKVRVETRTITQTVNTTSTATVSAPAVTQTATSTSTASGPAVTTTVTATTSPTPGKTATITLPVESRTSTATTTASAEPGPTVTVVGPGATATVTSTATATVPGPATTVTATATVPGPGVTVTSSGGSTATVPGPTVTVTSTSTVTAPALPGKTATITLPAETRTSTVTAPAEPGPTVTHTITVTAQPEQTGEPNDP